MKHNGRRQHSALLVIEKNNSGKKGPTFNGSLDSSGAASYSILQYLRKTAYLALFADCYIN